jgi:transposase
VTIRSGFIEELNNKIKVIKQPGKGIINIEHLFHWLFWMDILE